MGLSIPSKIVWWATQAALSPLGVVWFGLNTAKTSAGVVADTWRLLMDALRDPFAKDTYKKYWTRLGDWRKNYKADNKAGWKRFWAPYEGNRGEAYGLSKLTTRPTHAVYWWAKYGLWTALDFSRRAAATPFTWGGNLFLKKENRVKLWKWDKWFKTNMKKWRGSYGEGFKELKKWSSASEKKDKPEEKKDDKAKDESKDKKKEAPKEDKIDDKKDKPEEKKDDKEVLDLKERISKMEEHMAKISEQLAEVLEAKEDKKWWMKIVKWAPKVKINSKPEEKAPVIWEDTPAIAA